MTSDTESLATPRSLGARLLPWLLVLPVAALALPLEGWLSPFDPDPTLTATALVALALWPATLAVLGSQPRRGWHPLALAVPIVVGLSTLGAPDHVEGVRATLQAAILAVGFGCATHLDRKGRRTLCRALVLAALVFLTPPLWGHALGRPDALAGPLANVGPTNQVGLAGGVIGAWMVTLRRGGWRFVGALAAIAFALHAILAPVLAGGLAAVVALTVSALVSPWPRDLRRARAALSGAAGVLLFGLIAAGFAQRPPTVPAAATEQVAAEADGSATDADAAEDAGLARHLGGARVRLLVWRTLPAAIADAGPFGFGAGQFAAVYPPYRNPEERRASSFGTFVEHPHNDWLLVWVEFGWLGGLLATILLVWVTWRAWTGMSSTEVATSALGAALLALLVGAGAHSVLLGNPASGLIAAALCGACSAARRETEDNLAGRSRLSFATVALALGAAVFAWPLWRHGAALADYVAIMADVTGGELDKEKAEALDESLQRALRAEPESAMANGLRSELAMLLVRSNFEFERSLLRAQETSRALLEARPLSPGALVDSAAVRLWSKDTRGASQALHAALEIDPQHPAALENLARLELEYGDPLETVALLERLDEAGELEANERREIVRYALRNGVEPGRAAMVLGFDSTRPTTIYDTGEANDDPLLTALAHHLWARQHLDNGDVSTAIRSLQQAVNAYAANGIDAPLAIHELAAALWTDGRANDAFDTYDGLPAARATAAPYRLHVRLLEGAEALARLAG